MSDRNHQDESSFFSCLIAGMLVFTNRPVYPAGDLDTADGWLSVWFTSQEFQHHGAVNPGGSAESPLAWHRLPGNEAMPAIVSDDGRVALVQEPSSGNFDYAYQLRRVVPYAAALQGKLVLHASASRHPHGIVAFIGPSGVGKSTLAEHLDMLGYPIVSYDLLPIRIEEKMVTIPGEKNTPITAIYFLSRAAGLEKIHPQRLSGQDCLLSLLKHGFGELPEPRIWKVQFLGYEEIAAQVPAFDLQLPDDLSQLEASAKQVSAHFNRLQLTSPRHAELTPRSGSKQEYERAEFQKSEAP